MSEVWVAAAVTVVGGAIAGYGQQKKAEEDRKNANQDRKAATREEALYSGILSTFEREQDDYYEQLNRQRKQRGLEQFKQFSTMNEYAPNYVPAQGITLPEKPNAANTVHAGVQQDLANQQAVQPQQQAGGGSGSKQNALQRRLDPLKIF